MPSGQSFVAICFIQNIIISKIIPRTIHSDQQCVSITFLMSAASPVEVLFEEPVPDLL